jgi:hypothetical protein
MGRRKVDVEKLKQLYMQGLPLTKIAEQLGVSRYAVYSWSLRLRLPKRERRGRRKLDLEKFKQLCEQGLPSKLIAQQLGVSPTTVYIYRRILSLLKEVV